MFVTNIIYSGLLYEARYMYYHSNKTSNGLLSYRDLIMNASVGNRWWGNAYACIKIISHRVIPDQNLVVEPKTEKEITLLSSVGSDTSVWLSAAVLRHGSLWFLFLFSELWLLFLLADVFPSSPTRRTATTGWPDAQRAKWDGCQLPAWLQAGYVSVYLPYVCCSNI